MRDRDACLDPACRAVQTARPATASIAAAPTERRPIRQRQGGRTWRTTPPPESLSPPRARSP